MPLRGSETALMGSEKPLIGSERPLLGSEKPLMGSERPLMGSERPLMGSELGGDVRTYAWMENAPCVVQDLVPFGATAQNEPFCRDRIFSVTQSVRAQSDNPCNKHGGGGGGLVNPILTNGECD